MLRTSLTLLSLLTFLACSKQEKAPIKPPATKAVHTAVSLPEVNGTLALKEVSEFVSLGPRESGSIGASLAAKYIAGRLTTFGYQAVIEAFTNETPAGQVVFRNVYAIKPGTSTRSVLLASHFDTRANISEDFEGANDSGSSTGLLLELARIMNGIDPMDIGVGFAFFDGEECMREYGKLDGLHGSKRLATQIILKEPHPFGDVRAIIVLDMIGDRNLNVSIPGNTTPRLASLVLQAAHLENVRSIFSLSSAHMIDDHVPFTQIDIPAIDLIDYEFGSAPGLNDYWHTDEDTMDKLSAESLAIIGRVALRSVDLVRTSDL